MDSCVLSDLKTGAACFLCLGDQDLEAIGVVVAAYELAAQGGTDYTADWDALRTAAAGWKTISQRERNAILLYIRLQRAIDAGATFPAGTTVDALRTLAACFCDNGETQKNLLTFLECAYADAVEPA